MAISRFHRRARSMSASRAANIPASRSTAPRKISAQCARRAHRPAWLHHRPGAGRQVLHLWRQPAGAADRPDAHTGWQARADHSGRAIPDQYKQGGQAINLTGIAVAPNGDIYVTSMVMASTTSIALTRPDGISAPSAARPSRMFRHLPQDRHRHPLYAAAAALHRPQA